MRTLSYSIFFSMLVAPCAFSLLTPWSPPQAYNPLGVPVYYPPVSPPLYNPGPGNLPPSYSYTQQPPNINTSQASSNPLQQESISNLLSQNARNVIAKWRQRVVSFRATPDKITDTDVNISRDQGILETALSTPGLTSDEQNSIGQIKTLLDLALVRWLTSQISKGQKNFYTTRDSILSGTTSKIDPTWYSDKRDTLGRLLLKFKDFLNKNPQFSQEPPPILVGLLSSLIQGQKAFDQYQQFCSCFDHPELQYCADLSETSKNQAVNAKSSRNNQQGYDDQDYDDQGYDDQSY